MPLDTRIPLAAVQQRRSPLDTYGKALQLKGMQSQMKAQEDAQVAQEQRRNALKGAYGPEGLDYEAAERALLGVDDVEGAINMRGQKLREGEARSKAAAAEVKRYESEIGLMGNVLYGVQDQAGLDQARQVLQQRGIDLTGVPEVYDATTAPRIKMVAEAGIDPAKRAELAQKAAEATAKQANADRNYELNARRTAAYESGASQTNIQMPGQLSARPLTLEEIQQFNIPPEVAPYMHVDAKGNIARRPLGPGEEKRDKDEQDAQAQAATNAKAYQVWSTAAQGLSEGLQGTRTGPISGRITALTPEAQIGDAAVAATAPALKQLFRTAGEGTFTDRDQQMLLDMVPTRQTHPEARKAILRNIDAIIKSKLGIQEQGAPTSGPNVGDVVDGFEYIGGPPASPASWKRK